MNTCSNCVHSLNNGGKCDRVVCCCGATCWKTPISLSWSRGDRHPGEMSLALLEPTDCCSWWEEIHG